jgi:hypothetical protein
MLRKRVIAFFIACFVLHDLCAATYTIDKRQYVDDKWGTSTYSHILKVKRKGEDAAFCVAHLIKARVVLSRRCLPDLQELRNIEFVAYNDFKISACLKGSGLYKGDYYLDGSGKVQSYAELSDSGLPVIGNYTSDNSETVMGDWVVLRPCCYSGQECAELSDFVKNNSQGLYKGSENFVNYGGVIRRISAVGFDRLKILSDEEIKQFKKAYYNYLYDINNVNLFGVGPFTMPEELSREIYSNIQETKNEKMVLIGDFVERMEEYGVDPNLLNDSARLKELICTDFSNDSLPVYLLDSVYRGCSVYGYTADGTGVYGFAQVAEDKEISYFYGLMSPVENLENVADKRKGILVPVEKFNKYFPIMKDKYAK